jgi:hypothetical protein
MRSGSGGVPAGSMASGAVKDPAAVAQALRQLLARTEITDTRALIAVSDAVGTFRVLTLPSTATDKDVAAAVAKELAMDPEKIATGWVQVGGSVDRRLIYAAGWDRALLKGVTDAVRLAGLEAVAVELKSASIARAVAEPSCVVVDLSSEPVELVLIDDYLPRVWHSAAVKVTTGEDVAAVLGVPLRSVLRFYTRSNGRFGVDAPVFISGEQVLPGQVLEQLGRECAHPVSMLPPPPRVPDSVRHTTYLACLGLLMRRDA